MPEFLHFIQNVPQIVPESWCLQCKVCCRFPDTEGVQLPVWSEEESRWSQSQGWRWPFQQIPESVSRIPTLVSCSSGGHRCPAFQEKDQRCAIYPARPLDCRIYPFVLVRGPSESAVLALDTKCPYVQAHQGEAAISEYSQQLADYLSSSEAGAYLETNPSLIGRSWPEFLSVAPLPWAASSVSREPVRAPHPALQSFAELPPERLINALSLRLHAASAYSRALLEGWSDLLRIWWMEKQGTLVLISEQDGGYFLPLPPMGTAPPAALWLEVWALLEELNHGGSVSRVEGIESRDLSAWVAAGFQIREAEPEYLYRRADLAALRGDRYRAQRGSINRLLRGEKGLRRRPFQEGDLSASLQLYTRWAIWKQRRTEEPSQRRLIRDGLFFHRRLMIDGKRFGLTGWVVERAGRLVGYTFGAPISPKIFGIFLEVTEPGISGLGAWLFREFCRDLEGAAFINVMGDAGIEGLRQAKQRYRPVGYARTFIAEKWS